MSWTHRTAISITNPAHGRDIPFPAIFLTEASVKLSRTCSSWGAVTVGEVGNMWKHSSWKHVKVGNHFKLFATKTPRQLLKILVEQKGIPKQRAVLFPRTTFQPPQTSSNQQAKYAYLIMVDNWYLLKTEGYITNFNWNSSERPQLGRCCKTREGIHSCLDPSPLQYIRREVKKPLVRFVLPKKGEVTKLAPQGAGDQPWGVVWMVWFQISKSIYIFLLR